VAELIGVTRSGYREVPGPVRAGGRGAGDGRVGGGSGRVERGGKVSGFVAVEPGELAPCVDDHGHVLGRRADGERDGEAHVVVKGKLVWWSWDGPRWNRLGFEGQNKRRCLRGGEHNANGAKGSVKNK